MGPPTCDHAQAVGFVAQPTRTAEVIFGVHALLGIERERRTTEPRVVVQAGGHRSRRRIGLSRIDGQADLDALHLADASRAHELRRAPKLIHRTLLATDLHDAPALL